MKTIIGNLIRKSLKNLQIENVDVVLEHPLDLKMGDYSTNVAMASAKNIGSSPKDLAEKIKTELEKKLPKEIEKVEVAGPGFINFYLSRDFFENKVKDILEKGEDWGKNDLVKNKKIMVEYTQPNPFKPFHIGHLMSNAIGESISRIVEYSGAKVIRANYQGDIGPHVAKAIYGLITFGMPEESKTVSEKAQYIGECYSKGSNLYDTDEKIKKEIDEINKKIYNKSDEKINEIYKWGREVTLEAFEEIYEILGTKFNYYFFESHMAVIGEKIVKENIGEVFEESDGAVVFHGENYDPKLHTRVFMNSFGLPTYETKEIGLTITKFEKEDLDTSIVITAVEQSDYMKVVKKAISIMYPDWGEKMLHITHGMMRFAEGKMSSRKGNIITGESLLYDSFRKVATIMSHSKLGDKTFKLEDSEEDVNEKFDKEVLVVAKKVGVSALKYSILKSSLGADIIYDFEKSISFEGDSGPYLQYSAVRASSLLEKEKDFEINKEQEIPTETIVLEKLLYQFEEKVERSFREFAPHYITSYLTELASSFNTFYGNTKILDKENKFAEYHLSLVKAFHQTIKNGLWLLGIEVPERM